MIDRQTCVCVGRRRGAQCCVLSAVWWTVKITRNKRDAPPWSRLLLIDHGGKKALAMQLCHLAVDKVEGGEDNAGDGGCAHHAESKALVKCPDAAFTARSWGGQVMSLILGSRGGEGRMMMGK